MAEIEARIHSSFPKLTGCSFRELFLILAYCRYKLGIVPHFESSLDSGLEIKAILVLRRSLSNSAIQRGYLVVFFKKLGWEFQLLFKIFSQI